MTPRDRADRAKQLLADEVLTAAFADLRNRWIMRLESGNGDVDEHHQTALLLQALRQVRMQLEKYVDELAVDRHKINQQNFIARMRESLTPGWDGSQTR